MTRNYFEYLLRELKWENTKKQKRYAKRIETELQNSKKDFIVLWEIKALKIQFF